MASAQALKTSALNESPLPPGLVVSPPPGLEAPAPNLLTQQAALSGLSKPTSPVSSSSGNSAKEEAYKEAVMQLLSGDQKATLDLIQSLQADKDQLIAEKQQLQSTVRALEEQLRRAMQDPFAGKAQLAFQPPPSPAGFSLTTSPTPLAYPFPHVGMGISPPGSPVLGLSALFSAPPQFGGSPVATPPLAMPNVAPPPGLSDIKNEHMGTGILDDELATATGNEGRSMAQAAPTLRLADAVDPPNGKTSLSIEVEKKVPTKMTHEDAMRIMNLHKNKSDATEEYLLSSPKFDTPQQEPPQFLSPKPRASSFSMGDTQTRTLGLTLTPKSTPPRKGSGGFTPKCKKSPIPQPSPFVICENGGAVFQFTLRKADDKELGIVFEVSGSHLEVKSVQRGGAVEAWNKLCSEGPNREKVVRPGDMIVKVNDEISTEGMKSECASKTLCRFTVQRGECD